jgi:hypothetical protein
MPLDGVDFIDEATAVQLTPSPLYGMVSITDPGHTAPLKEGWGCGVLRLQFDDTEEASSFSPYGSSREIPFDRQDAQKIIQWLDRCVRQLAYVYVHCFGGISRSAAVAKFIAERYGLPFDHDYADYNRLVYLILKEEDMKTKTASTLRYRGAVYRRAARDVTLDDLGPDEKKMVTLWMRRHQDVKPGTPEYTALLKKYIQRVLSFPTNAPLDRRVMF